MTANKMTYSTSAAESFEFGCVSPVKRFDEFASISRWDDKDRAIWCYVLHDDGGDYQEGISEINAKSMLSEGYV